MATCLIALGANLGDRQASLEKAVAQLRSHPAIGGITVSRWVATRPIGGPVGQCDFLNGAVLLQTNLNPNTLMGVLHGIENQLGRVAGTRWAPRTLDIDLLLYDQRVIDTPTLVVPHPRMSFRRFVLVPAVDVAPDMVHPTIGWTLGELLDHLDTAVEYVAIGGPAGAGKTWLAERLSARFHGRLIRQPVIPDDADQRAFDWGGPAYATEIRFLEARVALLAANRWCAPPDADPTVLAVSDFWVDQGLVFASCHLAGALSDRFRAAWDAASRQMVRPKLLVVLDELPRRLGDQGSVARAASVGRTPERLRRALRVHAGQPGHGPTLWLAGRNRDECLAEAVAAIEAMRSVEG